MLKRTMAVALVAMASLLASNALAAPDGADDEALRPRRRARIGRRGGAERGERMIRRGRIGRRGEAERGEQMGWRDRVGRRGEARTRVAKRLLDRLTKELKLSEEQQEQLEGVMKEQAQAVRNWRSENGEQFRELRKQLIEARKAGDKDKVKEIAAKIKELAGKRQGIRNGLFDRLGDVLNKEQLAKAKEILRPRRRMRPMIALAAIRKLGLSEQQAAQAKKIMAGPLAKAGEAEGPREKVKILAPAVQQVVKEVLTDEQRKKLELMLRRNWRQQWQRVGARLLEGLDLTEEQEMKIRTLYKELREAMEKADTPQARREIFQAHRTKMEAVLTEAQLKKLRDRIQQGRRRRGDGARGDRGRRGDGARGDRGRRGRRGARQGRRGTRQGRRGGGNRAGGSGPVFDSPDIPE